MGTDTGPDGSDFTEYWQRLGVKVDRGICTLRVLADIMRAHSYVVPFENLTPISGNLAELNVPWLLGKISGDSRRGGFCYELNGLLAAGLRDLGFEVHFASARMWRPATAIFGPRDTHLALLVRCSDHPSLFLVDVGNSSWLVEPLELVHGRVQTEGQDGEAYQLLKLTAGDATADGCPYEDTAAGPELWRLYELVPVDAPTQPPPNALPPEGHGTDASCHSPCPPGHVRRLIFEMEVEPSVVHPSNTAPGAAQPQPRSLGHYAAMCAWTCTSKDSSFTNGLIITSRRPGWPGGRMALVSGPWAGSACGGVASTWNPAQPVAILWSRDVAHGAKTESVLTGWAAIAKAVQEQWGIRLDDIMALPPATS